MIEEPPTKAVKRRRKQRLRPAFAAHRSRGTTKGGVDDKITNE